jgi:hypothetical protein
MPATIALRGRIGISEIASHLAGGQPVLAAVAMGQSTLGLYDPGGWIERG